MKVFRNCLNPLQSKNIDELRTLKADIIDSIALFSKDIDLVNEMIFKIVKNSPSADITAFQKELTNLMAKRTLNINELRKIESEILIRGGDPQLLIGSVHPPGPSSIAVTESFGAVGDSNKKMSYVNVVHVGYAALNENSSKKTLDPGDDNSKKVQQVSVYGESGDDNHQAEVIDSRKETWWKELMEKNRRLTIQMYGPYDFIYDEDEHYVLKTFFNDSNEN